MPLWDVGGWEDLILEDAAHNGVRLMYRSWSWTFQSFCFNISNSNSQLTSPSGTCSCIFVWSYRINKPNTEPQDQMKAIIQHHLPPPPFQDLSGSQTDHVEHNVVLQKAALGERCANTSGVMTFISFLFYSPLLLTISHSYMETRSGDLITHFVPAQIRRKRRCFILLFFLQS